MVRQTKAKAFVLLEATALRAMVELRLRSTLQDPHALERLLATSGIINADSVERHDRSGR